MSIAAELTQAAGLVNEKFNQMTTIGDSVYSTTMGAIQSLQQIANALQEITGTVQMDTSAISMPEMDVDPPEVDTASMLFEGGTAPDPGGVGITDPALVNVPTFVTLSSPATVGTPEMPMITRTGSAFPTLSGTDPIVQGDELTPTPYVSVLMEALRAKLYNDLTQGVSGIEPAIEDAIWRREEERALQSLEDSLDRKASLWSEIGWDLPDGMLGAMLQEEQLTYLNSRLTTSRDVAIKSAELALQNAHFVIQQGVAFQTMLVQWVNLVAQRAYEVSKATSDAQLAKYREDVANAAAQVNIDIERFKGDIQKKNINADVSKANVEFQVQTFKGNVDSNAAQTTAVIEASKAKIAYNASKVALYEAQINAFNANMNALGMKSKAAADSVNAEANVYQASSSFAVGKGTVALKAMEAIMQQGLGNMNLLIHDKEIRAKNGEILGQLRVGAAEAIARIAAQLAAGAWSAVSAGATMGFRADLNEIHTYKEETGQLTTP